MAIHLLSLALVAVPVLSIPTLKHTPRDGIAWKTCNDTWWAGPELRCNDFSVPLDWDAPEGESITLRLMKLPRPSNSSSKSLGSLFINPGGPGDPATRLLGEIAGGFLPVSREVINSFDIIAVEPRGIQESGNLICDDAIWKERVSKFPKTQEEYDRLVDKNRRLGESCIEQTGGLVKYLDTISVARDHEAVRKAIGDDTVSWVGLSYGSQLASQYAELFPGNVRAMVLDGMLQHSQAESTNILIETTAYSTALESFFKWAGTDDESPLKGQDVGKFWYDLLKNATETPIPAPDCIFEGRYSCHGDVTEDELRTAAQGSLISASTSSRIAFAEALVQASNGDASSFAERFPHSTFDPRHFWALAIGCQDWAPAAPSFAGFQAKMHLAETFAPLTKGASQTWTLQASCAGWPAPLRNPLKKLDVKTKNPVLIVNSLRDPSTSYAWAVGMLEEIESAVLLTRDGDGHTSWGIEGKTTEAIDHYLLTLETPEPGTVFDS